MYIYNYLLKTIYIDMEQPEIIGDKQITQEEYYTLILLDPNIKVMGEKNKT